jgi:site-specific recombinase XerD
MSAAGLERPKQPRSLPRYIERDTEIARVLAMAATRDPAGRMVWPERDIALAALLAGTGIRAGELCGLRLRDLVLRGAAAHAFRHTVAMQLINRGEPVNVVQALLGHASLSSTQIYIRAAGHHVREAAHGLPVRQQLRKIGHGGGAQPA